MLTTLFFAAAIIVTVMSVRSVVRPDDPADGPVRWLAPLATIGVAVVLWFEWDSLWRSVPVVIAVIALIGLVRTRHFDRLAVAS